MPSSQIYTAALGSADLSEMKRLRIGEAAQLNALAELARGNYMRDSNGSLDDVVRVERRSSAAERALGIDERPRDTTPTLEEYLAATANRHHVEAAE